MSAELHEDEWSLDGFMAACDRVTVNPPAAPDGIELIECSAEPRHWPTYVAHVDGMYPAPCPSCLHDDLRQERDRLEHEARHRRWHRWPIVGKFARYAYPLGLIAGSGVSYNSCEKCPVRYSLKWRGRRPYILGKQREWWSCLVQRRHIRTATHITAGLCSKCCPCPECGSTADDHYVCFGEDA